MKVKYNSISDSRSGFSATIEIDEPNLCPMCNYSLKPSLLYTNLFYIDDDEVYFYAVYHCTKCNNIFIAKFSNHQKRDKNPGGYVYTFSKLDLIAPSKFKNKEFDDCIESVSQSFVKIYNQALEAEHYNLEEIAGIGYRKALEFLIKDYCIFKNPSSKEDISKRPLAQIVEDYIDDVRLKKTAKASVWLGNDETHYIKKFTNKDINDLKKFIDTTVYFILYNLNVDEADNILNSQ